MKLYETFNLLVINNLPFVLQIFKNVLILSIKMIILRNTKYINTKKLHLIIKMAKVFEWPCVLPKLFC